MEIEIKPNQEIVIVIRNRATETVQTEMAQLVIQKETYLAEFIEILYKEEVHSDDFLLLKINLSELEAQANQVWQAIVEEYQVNKDHAQELKQEYDEILDNLNSMMSETILSVIPEKRNDLEEKIRLYTSSKDISPAAMLDLQNAIQEFNLMVTEMNEQVKRVDLLRLFQLY